MPTMIYISLGMTIAAIVPCGTFLMLEILVAGPCDPAMDLNPAIGYL